jgi:hypothetical protein
MAELSIEPKLEAKLLPIRLRGKGAVINSQGHAPTVVQEFTPPHIHSSCTALALM